VKRQNVNTWTNMLSPPAEGNFYDKHGKSLKSAMVQDYDKQGKWTNLTTTTNLPLADDHGN
jgi:hypothetical protein